MISSILTLHGIAFPMESIAELCRRYHVRELALFGSILRDNFRPDSDIDILVEFEPDAEVDLIDYQRSRESSSELLGRRVELASKPWLKPLYRRTIAPSARVIYAA